MYISQKSTGAYAAYGGYKNDIISIAYISNEKDIDTNESCYSLSMLLICPDGILLKENKSSIENNQDTLISFPNRGQQDIYISPSHKVLLKNNGTIMKLDNGICVFDNITKYSDEYYGINHYNEKEKVPSPRVIDTSGNWLPCGGELDFHHTEQVKSSWVKVITDKKYGLFMENSKVLSLKGVELFSKLSIEDEAITITLTSDYNCSEEIIFQNGTWLIDKDWLKNDEGITEFQNIWSTIPKLGNRVQVKGSQYQRFLFIDGTFLTDNNGISNFEEVEFLSNDCFKVKSIGSPSYKLLRKNGEYQKVQNQKKFKNIKTLPDRNDMFEIELNKSIQIKSKNLTVSAKNIFIKIKD